MLTPAPGRQTGQGPFPLARRISLDFGLPQQSSYFQNDLATAPHDVRVSGRDSTLWTIQVQNFRIFIWES